MVSLIFLRGLCGYTREGPVKRNMMTAFERVFGDTYLKTWIPEFFKDLPMALPHKFSSIPSPYQTLDRNFGRPVSGFITQVFTHSTILLTLKVLNF